MSNIQDIISKALALWSKKHAESTVRCQGIYFSALFKAAEEGGFDSPCQELYDIFLKGAKTPAVCFNRSQAVKAVDLIAGTHAINKDGSFYNEPPFPTYEETCILLSSVAYPISGPVDISFLIVYAASMIERQGTSHSGQGQYWHSWRDIRTYCFRHDSSMNYNPETLKRYLGELDEKFGSGSLSETKYYMHRKAALILEEITETGQFQWKRSPRKPIQPLEGPELEDIRQQYLSFLRENNYAERTIQGRDYIFRNMIRFSGVRSAEELYHLSASGVGDILKGFAGICKCMDSPTTLVRLTLQYLYEQGMLEVNRAEMVMPPFRHHGNTPCYIPEKEDEKFYEALEGCTKRNTAIILLARELGLRSCDICSLKFSQIDWEGEKIRLNQQKTGEPVVLPLLPEVGNAIYEYIRDERPKVDDGYPFIFLRTQAPFTRITRIYEVSNRFIKKSSIKRKNGSQRGMHLYRRTLANRLLLDEVPHQVITDTLGHASKEADKPYIPMEESMLRECALGLDGIGVKSWEGGDGNE